MRQRGRIAGLGAIVGALFLLSALSIASAGDVMFQVSPKKLTKAGPVLLFASGLKPGQAYQYRAVVKHPKITIRGDHKRVTAR